MDQPIIMRMDSKALEHSTGNQTSYWSDYVELSKYFSGPVKRCLSMPCLPIARGQLPDASSLAAPAPSATGTRTELVPISTGLEPARPNLSLSWQLACNPADPAQRQEYKAQRQPAAGLHCKGGRQADSMLRAKPKKKMAKRQGDSAESPGDMPKIVVVDANKLSAYWNQQPPAEEREPLPKKTVLKIKNPYAVPLCARPTTILGSHLSAQQDQQRHRYPHPRHFHTDFHARRLQPLQHLVKDHNMLSPKYAVPLESMYSSLKKGSRYCGNFYYK